MVRLAIIKKPKNICWRGCGEKELFYTVKQNVNWYSHYGEQCGSTLKARNRTAIGFSGDSSAKDMPAKAGNVRGMG